MQLSILILTGQSGSGKSVAIRTLEDHGWYCVDNLPTRMAGPLIELVLEEKAVNRLALVMDLRAPHFAELTPALVEQLRRSQNHVRLLYLEAKEEALVRRFSETRRIHPGDCGDGLRKAIAEERELLAPLRELADDTLDTSAFSPHELRARIARTIAGVAPGDAMRVAVLSFGFKHGLPLDADIVLDVRFLPNPYFVEWLRHLNGRDAPVREFVLGTPEARAFSEHIKSLLAFLVPQYQREGKRYLTVAIGCTGGQHRSVAVAGQVAQTLEDQGVHIDLRHRDLPREATQS